jgi:lysozyme
MANWRIPVAALTLSFAAGAGLMVSEGYVEVASIPTQNDKPTYGFGSTTKEDGSAVRIGERTTPMRAVKRTAAYLANAEADMKDTLQGVDLTQGEFDVYMNWRYQYGIGAWRKSSMLADLKDGSYVLACYDLLRYRFSGGYDCSTPGNKRCAGVWTRQLDRFADCWRAQ